MPTGKKQTRNIIKDKRRKEAQSRQNKRNLRGNENQLLLLDSKNLTAKRERTRLEKKIEKAKEI